MLLKIIKYLIVLNLLSNICNANEEFFKFHKLKIKSFSEKNLEKIGFIKGNIEEYPYGFTYYANTSDNELSELIELFYFDNFGDHMSRFNKWARDVVYLSNPNEGCNNSEYKIYHDIVDSGPIHFNCFSTKLISSSIKDISGPNFNATEHIPMVKREAFLKKYLKKNKLKIPDQFFRSEHYLYKSGKLIWVFYSINPKIFYEKLNEKNMQKLTNKSVLIHENFENDLKFKNYMKISFTNRLEKLFNKGVFTDEELKLFKQKLLSNN